MRILWTEFDRTNYSWVVRQVGSHRPCFRSPFLDVVRNWGQVESQAGTNCIFFLIGFEHELLGIFT